MKDLLPRCPVETTLLLIDNRWKPLIWCAIFYEKKRFGEIRKNVGKISTKVLTTNLRSMEDDGLITRKIFPEIPPRVEYSLTEMGYSLKPILYAMVEWGSNYKYENEKIMPMRTTGGILMTIQRAVKNDMQEILQLQYLAYQSEAQLFENPNIPPLSQTLEDIEEEFDTGIFLKVQNEDNLIVASVRAFLKDDTLHIGKLIVQPDLQGQGIGTKLLKEIERICPQKRYELFTSSKSTRNIKLYEHVGYQIFSEKVISDELKLIYLEKNS